MALPAQGSAEKMVPPGPADGRMAKCSICYEAYRGAASGRAPKLLGCRHSVCLACLRELACRNTAFPFVVCPFCRTPTAVPEGGLRALRDDESLLQEMAPAQGGVGAEAEEGPEEGEDAPGPSGRPRSDAALALEFSYGPGSSVFAVSSFVPAYSAGLHSGVGVWGRFQLQEVGNAVVVELPNRAASRDSETPATLENLRLCFAVTIILIVSVFFALVFFK